MPRSSLMLRINLLGPQALEEVLLLLVFFCILENDHLPSRTMKSVKDSDRVYLIYHCAPRA